MHRRSVVPDTVHLLTTRHTASRRLLHLDASAMHGFWMIVSTTTSMNRIVLHRLTKWLNQSTGCEAAHSAPPSCTVTPLRSLAPGKLSNNVCPHCRRMKRAPAGLAGYLLAPRRALRQASVLQAQVGVGVTKPARAACRRVPLAAREAGRALSPAAVQSACRRASARLCACIRTPGKSGMGGAQATSAGRVGGAPGAGARRGTQVQKLGRLQRAACVGPSGMPAGRAARGQAAMRPASAPRASGGGPPREAGAGCGPGHGCSAQAGNAAVRVLARRQAPALPAGAVTLPVGGVRKRRAAASEPEKAGAGSPSRPRKQMVGSHAHAPRVVLRMRSSKRQRTDQAAHPDTPQHGGRAGSVLSPPRVCLARTQGRGASHAAADCPAMSAAKGRETDASVLGPGTPAVREPAAAVGSSEPVRSCPGHICEVQPPDNAGDGRSSATATRTETSSGEHVAPREAPRSDAASYRCAVAEAALGMRERACCSTPGAPAGAPRDMANGGLRCRADAPKQAAPGQPVSPACPGKAELVANGLVEALSAGTEMGAAAAATGCSLGVLRQVPATAQCLSLSNDTLSCCLTWW